MTVIKAETVLFVARVAVVAVAAGAKTAWKLIKVVKPRVIIK